MSTTTISSSSTWAGGNSPFKVSYGKLMMWIFLLSDAFTFSSLLIGYGAVRYSFPSTEDKIEQLTPEYLASKDIPMDGDLISFKFNEKIIERYATPEAVAAQRAKEAKEAAESGEVVAHHGADGEAVAHEDHTDYFVQKLGQVDVFEEDHWPSPDLVFNHFPFIHGRHLPLLFVSLMTLILIFSSVTMVLGVEAGQRGQKKAVSKWMLWTIIGGLAFLGCQAWEWTQFINAGATPWANPYGPASFAALFFLVTGFHGFHVFSGVVLNVIVYINNIKGTYEKRGHYEMVEKVGLYWHFVDLVWVFVFTFFYLI